MANLCDASLKAKPVKDMLLMLPAYLPFLTTLAEQHYTLAQKETLATELFKCLVAKSYAKDPMELSIPPLLDQLWHAFLMETKSYQDFCQLVCNKRFLHHTTLTANDPLPKKLARVNNTINVYMHLFKTDPSDLFCWELEEEEETASASDDDECTHHNKRHHSCADEDESQEEEENEEEDGANIIGSNSPEEHKRRHRQEEYVKVSLKTLTGKTIVFQAKIGTRLIKVVKAFSNQEGIPFDQIRFIVNGKQDPNIVLTRDHREVNVTIVLKLRGC